MAKVKIKYEVDDKQLDALQKQLNDIKGQNKEVEESWEKNNKKVKESGGALGNLKSTIAGIGLAALAIEGAKAFAQLTEEINKARKEAAQLTGLTGRALDQFTAKTRATAQVFDKDFNEVLRAANTVSKEFGVSLTDAINSINDGFSTGIDINGDYLETLREYSTFINQAGLSQNQFNTLIRAQIQEGIFSDKGIDAIKEAVISIQEMTPATQDALRAVGFNTTELIRDIESGAKTYFDVVQEIGVRLRDVTDPRVRGQVLADVFRGAGEDAGDFALNLDTVLQKYKELTPEQERFKASTDALLASEEDLNEQLVAFSTNFTGLSSQFRTFLNEFSSGTLRLLNDIINGFDNVDKKTKSFRDSLETLDLDQRAGELQRLKDQAAGLNNEITRIESRELTFFENLFGGKNEATKAREDLEDVNLQIAILNELEKERTTIIKDEPTIRKQSAAATKEQIKALEDLNRVSGIGGGGFVEQAQRKQAANETIKNLEQKLNQDIQSTNEQRVETARALQDQLSEIEQDGIDQRNELINQSISGVLDIYSSFTQRRIQQIDQQIQANELARNRELEQAEGNAQQQQQINERFDQKQRALRTKQVQEEKKSQLFSAIVTNATNVIKALGTPPVPNFIAAGIAAGFGLAQIGFIAGQQPPKFAKGVIGLKGPGTSTSDSIPAMLSVDESVMTAKETHDFRPTLEAIRQKRIKSDVINAIAMNGGHAEPLIINDYDKLAKAIEGKPEKNVIIDENGMTGYFKRKYDYVKMKQSKFKM